MFWWSIRQVNIWMFRPTLCSIIAYNYKMIIYFDDNYNWWYFIQRHFLRMLNQAKEPKQRLLFWQSVRRNNKRVKIYIVWNKYSDNFTALLPLSTVLFGFSTRQFKTWTTLTFRRTSQNESGREATKRTNENVRDSTIRTDPSEI